MTVLPKYFTYDFEVLTKVFFENLNAYVARGATKYFKSQLGKVYLRHSYVVHNIKLFLTSSMGPLCSICLNAFEYQKQPKSQAAFAR